MSERCWFRARDPLIAAAALALAACASTPTRESAGEYMDDSMITTKVIGRLVAEPQIHSTDIEVTTFKGTVQLSGFVNDRDEAARAADVASRVTGVREVKNDLRDKAAADLSSR